MFGLPEQYTVNRTFATKTFIPAELSLNDKKRLRETLLSVTLSSQITGEAIPSLADEEHYCQAILFFEVKLKKLKDAVFVSGIIQTKVKELCVIRFFDAAGEMYSFVTKRLNQQDTNEIVLEDSYLTPELPVGFPNETKRELLNQLDFNNIRNRNNKLCFYLEIMLRAFIVTGKGLYSKQAQLLDSKVWYNYEDTKALLSGLKQLLNLKAALKSAAVPAEKIRLNGEIKQAIESLHRFL